MKRLNISLVVVSVVLLVFSVFPGLAQSGDTSNPSPLKFPTPKGITNQLFYLQRDPNLNTLIYELNVKDGVIDRDEPVIGYWIRYGEGGKKQDMSYVQKKFAYGVESKELGKDHFELRFVSHKKLALYLQRTVGDKKFHVYVTINNKKLLLDRIFVRIEGGSFWLPNVRYVELRGLNPESNTVITERIKV
jgi:hypothetical protein